MIPRLKPFIDQQELFNAINPYGGTVADFESAFAEKFKVKYAVSFPYGRSALWAFFKALGIKNREIIQPAYTCVVVAHATVLSENYPVFIDCDMSDYNMNLDQLETKINENTRVIIATHLFGYPLNLDRLDKIVKSAEKKYGRKIWVIQDAAHSFDADWQGKSVVQAGDAALFGLNISKTITSIFGGMLVTNNPVIFRRLLKFRDLTFVHPPKTRYFKRLLYLLASSISLSEKVYGLTYYLQEHSRILDKQTKAYHLDNRIHFPPDFIHFMSSVEARVGLKQLIKYEKIINHRRELAEYYSENIKRRKDWELPQISPGATYSHYVIRVPDRRSIMEISALRGIQLGQLIEYSIPHLPEYSGFKQVDSCPNSLYCSNHTINLPIHCGVDKSVREKIVRQINSFI